jgi:hypothetical protein
VNDATKAGVDDTKGKGVAVQRRCAAPDPGPGTGTRWASDSDRLWEPWQAVLRKDQASCIPFGERNISRLREKEIFGSCGEPQCRAFPPA